METEIMLAFFIILMIVAVILLGAAVSRLGLLCRLVDGYLKDISGDLSSVASSIEPEPPSEQ